MIEGSFMTDLISADRLAAQTSDTPSSRTRTNLYRAVWRWHFYAGFFTAPILIALAVSGLMILWIGVLDGRDGENSLDVMLGAAVVAPSQQVQAARSAVPSGKFIAYILPHSATGPAMVRIDDEGEHRMVAVDPYRGKVLDSWSRRAGWYDFADNFHGSLLLGNFGDRVLEIAAGFGLLLVATGAYLWWPRNGGDRSSAFVPNLAAQGRSFFKSLHRVVGFYTAGVLVLFLLTGMSWTGIWGEKIMQAWSTFPAEKWDAVPSSDVTHAVLNEGGAKEVPWTLEQTPLPISGSKAGRPGIAEGQPVDVDSVTALAERLGVADHGRFHVSAPTGQTGVWTIAQDSMSADSTEPMSDRTIHVDRYSGRILADVRFADYSLAGKTMAVGTAFHMGLMGWWNIALNTVFCLAVIFLSLTGLVLWWMRRPKGRVGLSAPAAPDSVPLVKGVAFIALLLSVVFPLLGLTLIAVIAFDLLVVSRVPALKRALG